MPNLTWEEMNDLHHKVKKAIVMLSNEMLRLKELKDQFKAIHDRLENSVIKHEQEEV